VATLMGDIAVLGANLAISVCPSFSQLLGDIFVKLAMVENPVFATLSYIFGDISIYRFGGNITISGWRPLLRSLADTFTPDLPLEFECCLS